MAAARTEVEQRGTLSLKLVAARAGVSRQAIHYHFGGARGLRAALAAEGVTEVAGDGTPTRERILAAADRLLARPGGSFVSIDAIGAEAGMTKGAVYHHFPDRNALLSEVAGRVSPFGELADALARAEHEPLRAALAILADAYYRAMTKRADFVRNLAAASSGDPELALVVMGQIIGQGMPVMLAWFRRRIDAGEMRAVEPTLLLQALFGPMFLRIVLGNETFDRLASVGVRVASDNVDAFVDILIGGIAAEPSAQPTKG
jgi:AcrR family transcriptional regulator